MVKHLDYDNVDWSQFFYYDTESKSCLKWSTDNVSIDGKRRTLKMGKDVGYLARAKNGRIRAWVVEHNVCGKTRSYFVHRIIAVLRGEKVNGFVIDHINGVPTDNRNENIRVTTQTINSRNKKPRTNSPYGISGVTFRQRKDGAFFTTRYSSNGSETTKMFSIQRLGLMEAFKQAVIYRQRAISKLNDEGYDYTDRHTLISDAIADYSTYVEYKDAPFIKTCNTSGVTGVHFWTNNIGYLYSVASWTVSGKPKKKSFSVLKYGLLPAFAMAVEYRSNITAKLYKE